MSELVYLSGPITGIDNYEENFSKAEKKLKLMGYRVCNPVILGKEVENDLKKLNRSPTWKDYMVKCMEKIFNCDAIYMLPGWENSRGAKIEREIAIGCEMKFISVLNTSVARF